MDCQKVKRGLSRYLDGALPGAERRQIGVHLDSCDECSRHFAELRLLRNDLRQMQRAPLPAMLATQLRVIASRERARRIHQFNFWRLLWLRIDQFMRPLMVPAAGGLLSSFLLFGVLADTLHWNLELGKDIPLGVYTQISVDEASPFQFTGNDIMVELTINEQGSVSDFAIPNGNLSRKQMREIGNWILFTSFHPATHNGQPTTGKVLVSFHRINVKG